MELHFVDQNRDAVFALEKAFQNFPEVSCACGDILALAEGCVVSLADAYGYMDGGIDAVYRRYFGPQLEDKIREAIAARPEGHLPIGTSLVVTTGHPRVPYMIVAPTMLMPEQVDASHAARAFGAVLRIQARHAATLPSIFCPGLATGVGAVDPMKAATAMATVYREVRKRTERTPPHP